MGIDIGREQTEQCSLHAVELLRWARKINLTKIESRPKRQTPWEYNFYLDFEGHHDDARIRETLAEVEGISTFFKILGSYPRTK